MTTLSSYPPPQVYFSILELSEQHPDLLVAAMSHAIVTIHKVTREIRILAGEPALSGYVEGVGRAARFYTILGVAQLEYKYILSDRVNNCLRSVDYLSNETQTFAGLCGSRGTADGSLLLARFYSPRGMMRDLGNPDVIYLADYLALRKIDLSAETVITLPSSYLSSAYRTGITMSPAGSLFVSSYHGVIQYTLNETIRWLTGSTIASVPPCEQCDISSARFNYPSQLRFITPEVLLMADTSNYKLRLINLTSGVVTAIGAGQGYQNGHYQNSKLLSPYSIAVDNSFIYIGENTASGGGVRELAYTGGCDFLSFQ